MHTSPKTLGFSQKRLSRISTMLQGYVDRDELAGLIAMVGRNGQAAYYETFGWMDREARTPMRDDTIFMIASMTKPIVSVAIMMLYEEGYFHLNTPIATFVPAFQDTKVLVGERDGELELADLQQPITFRHLFTHTAGISYGWDESDPVDRQYQAFYKQFEQSGNVLNNATFLDTLPSLPLAFQPGTRWRYSRSIDVLGALIERIAGQPLETFLQERLFAPLGMTDTSFYVPPKKAGRLATMYGRPEPGNGLQRIEQIRPPSEPPVWASGGGGLTSTMHDYARFAQMLANGGELDGTRILGPRTVALYSMNHTPAQALPYGFRENDFYHAGYGYSLGTRVLMDVSESGIDGSVGEFGWDGAFSTYFWIDPRESLYGILMTQHSPNAFHPVHQQFKQLTYQALVK